ncbi:MAG: hypothetical protein HY589_04150 [Candidatus Omnitrophica bacterium]|nr:hypothetical protein [Candidatus Omnitrophota bacterium]
MRKQELGNQGGAARSGSLPAGENGAKRSGTSAQKKAPLSQFKLIEVSKIKKARQLKDYAVISERNPFKPYEGASKGKGEGKGELVSGKQKKSSILSETPEFLYRGSVMAGGILKCALEDVETKEIYFLKKDETIGEYFVLDIQRDKVILSQKKGGGELIVPLFE